jgi:hypothetical protein
LTFSYAEFFVQISEKSVSSRERLRNAFDTLEKEFNISKLLDPEDVDVENPDEKSLITYVSSLYNALAHDEVLSRVSWKIFSTTT